MPLKRSRQRRCFAIADPALACGVARYKGGGVQFFCDVLMDKQPKPNDGQLVPQEPGIAGHAEPAIAGAGAAAQPEPEPLERETTASVRQLCNVARDSGLLYLRDHAQVSCCPVPGCCGRGCTHANRRSMMRAGW